MDILMLTFYTQAFGRKNDTLINQNRHLMAPSVLKHSILCSQMPTKVRFFSSSSSPSTKASTSGKTPTVNLPITFNNGYFRIELGNAQCVFHFWSPLSSVMNTFKEELSLTVSGENENLRRKINCNLISVNDVKLFMKPENIAETSVNDSSDEEDNSLVKTDQIMRLAPSMPLGYAFVALDINQIYMTVTGCCEGDTISKSQTSLFQFQFDDVSDTIKLKLPLWVENNNKQSGSFNNKWVSDSATASDFYSSQELMVNIFFHFLQ